MKLRPLVVRGGGRHGVSGGLVFLRLFTEAAEGLGGLWSRSDTASPVHEAIGRAHSVWPWCIPAIRRRTETSGGAGAFRAVGRAHRMGQEPCCHLIAELGTPEHTPPDRCAPDWDKVVNHHQFEAGCRSAKAVNLTAQLRS